ncbi:MAG: PadR family transcriptional regulator [Oscillospiraceae bacterium]|nr:PadR family transcriptional regulator [Oscillospiraceae bacterium]
MNENIIRQFKKGVLELIILKLLSKKEMYGYELVAELNRQSNAFHIKEGTLYPILYRLEDDGLMKTRWEQPASRVQPKKYYSVTDKGGQFMRESYAQWKALAEDITRIMEDAI